jgi:hypothetical protein
MMCTSTQLRLSFCALLIASQSFIANAQNASCSYTVSACAEGIAANFNIDDEGFTGSNGFMYNGTAGNFGIAALQSNVNNYILTSDSYLANAATIRVGADFSGAGSDDINAYRIDVLDASTNAILAFCSVNIEQVPGVNSGSICQTISNINFNNRTVRFRLTLSTDSDASGSFSVDNFRTNLPLGGTTPVEFTGFDATKVSNGVLLTWNVATEANVKNYEVEKSADGRNYNKIGQVKATNSNSYSFTDIQASTGIVYYRIKNVDNDGKFKYSTVLTYDNGRTVLQFKAFPTATKGLVTFQHPAVRGAATITVSTLDGRILKSIAPGRGSINTPVELSQFPSGTYLLRYQGEGHSSEAFRIFKQ